MKSTDDDGAKQKNQAGTGQKDLTREQLLAELDRMQHLLSSLETRGSEQHRAEQSLKKIGQHYKSLFNNAPICFQSLDKNGRIIEVNVTWLESMGYPRDEVLGRWFGDFVAPEYVNDFRKFFPRFVSHGLVSGLELELVRKNDSRFVVAFEGKATYNDSGDFQQSQCVFHDVTEQRSIQDKILESREKFETLLKNLPCAVYSAYPAGAGGMFYISDKWQEWTGLAPGEVYRDDHAWEKIIHPDDRKKSIELFYDALKKQQAYDIEYRIINKTTGNHYFLRDHGVPIRDQDGRVIRFDGYITDITERREAEKVLVESERNYRTIFNTVNEAICVHDAGTGRIIDVNDKMCEMWGYDRDQILAMNVGQISSGRPPYSQAEALEYIRKAAEGSPQIFEWIGKKSGGELFWIEVNIKKAAIGGKERLLALIRDISERKQDEEALIRSEEKWRSITEDSPDSIMVLDLEGRIQFINHTVEGINREDVIGTKVYDFVSPSEKQAIRDCFTRVIKTGRPDEYESHYTTPDGKTIFFRSRVAGIKESGKVTTFVVSSRDLTAQKSAEEEIRIARDKAEKYLEMAGNIFLALDDKQNVAMVNRKGCEILDLPESEIIGKDWINVFIHEMDKKDTRAAFEKILSGEMDFLDNRESRIITKNGEFRLITWNDTGIKDDSGRVIGTLSSGLDITETKKLQEEVLRTSKLESVGMLAGGIAHDFNNILTAVLGNISLGQKKIHPEDDAYDILKRAERAAIRAKDLTKQLLTFAKGGEPVKKTAYIMDLLRETAAFSLRGSNVRCKFSISKGLWPVDVDEGQFVQVINNLVINAKQCMWEGGLISIRAANLYIRKSSGLPLKAGRYIKISVKDRGIGISKENIRKIFDPYFSTRQNGSGLGLASAFSIVKNHGGHISVRSELGSGTTFDVYLPASDNVAAVPESSSAAAAADKGRVLVMDDEPMIREVAGEMLLMLGYEVELARNGEEAIKKYSSALTSDYPFKAVIVDLTIPGGMGGQETIKKLLEIDPGVKAIVSSGYSNDPIMADYRQHGFSGIVVKPYRIAELWEALVQVLNNK